MKKFVKGFFQKPPHESLKEFLCRCFQLFLQPFAFDSSSSVYLKYWRKSVKKSISSSWSLSRNLSNSSCTNYSCSSKISMDSTIFHLRFHTSIYCSHYAGHFYGCFSRDCVHCFSRYASKKCCRILSRLPEILGKNYQDFLKIRNH